MKIAFAFILFFCSIAAQAQTVLPDCSEVFKKAKPKNYFGLRVGGTASTFSHDGRQAVSLLSDKSLISWHAGLSADFFTKKYYNARVELSYINKGAKETFANDAVSIESVNRIQYAQLSILPVVVKPGFKKINPYLALGGYYARGIGIKLKWKPGPNADWEEDKQTADNLNITQDYGYSVSLGVYVWRRPFFEIRYEGGLSSLSNVRKVNNRSLILSVSI